MVREDPMHVALRVGDDPQGELLMIDPAHALEDMTEWPMPEIVQKTTRQGKRLGFVVDLMQKPQLGEHLPRRFHDAEAMAISTVIRPRVGQRRHAELANPPQALEFRGVEELEEERVG